jgi:hypothetical protein
MQRCRSAVSGRRRGPGRRARALPLALLVAVALAACSGKKVDPDEANAAAVARQSATEAQVACNGDVCTARILEALPSSNQAWFLALPVVSGVESDPDLEDVRRLELTFANGEGTREARFDCSLRPDAGQFDLVNVEFVHDRCRGSFSGF